MRLTDTVKIPDQVMARSVGDELVILDLASGTYFGLDGVGMLAWHVLSEGGSLADACAAVLAEYDVARETVEADIVTLVADLAAKGLVELA